MEEYDPDMDLGYRDLHDLEVEAKSIEVSLTFKDPNSDDEFSMMWDNLTHPMYFLVQNNLLPASEYLEERGEILLPEGEKELPGLEGTEIDGVTAQAVLDGWRAQQGDRTLVIEVDANPQILRSLHEMMLGE